MEDFFKSKKFKILLAFLVIIFAFALRGAYTGGLASFSDNVIGIISVPFQRISSSISEGVYSFLNVFLNASNISKENEELKAKIEEMNKKLVDYDKFKRENENLKEFLEIKEQNPEFEFETATVIGRDANSKFYSFTIDKGSLNGIELRDTVITSKGLVGVVNEVGISYSKVITVLDASLDVGTYISTTRDVGIVTGRISEAEKGNTLMTFLPKDVEAKKGDIVLTSGYGGNYPKDIIVGEITEIRDETHGLSKYAVIKPASDIKNVKDVLVIKSFLGENKGRDIIDEKENTEKTNQK